MVKKLAPNFCLVINIFTIKKATVVSNFCLIGKIHHDLLVPTMIELGCKTFIPFQTSDLHRVTTHTGYKVPGIKKGVFFYLERAIRYRPKL
jgi:hypothetical protein